jgi:hypothetical protein
MKKLLAVTILCGLVSGVFAQTFDFNSWTKADLFDTALYQNNSSSVTRFAFTPEQKGVRAERNKWPAFILNTALGFGIGSFVQGDTLGGFTGLLGDLAGIGLFWVGLYGPYFLPMSFSPWMYFGGMGVFAVSRIIQMVRPFTYANKFFVAVAPDVDTKGNMALTASARIKL